ncbi:Intracellular serine protease [compost metagenome]
MDFKLPPHAKEAGAFAVGDIPEGIKTIHAPELWAKGVDGDGVVVAVLDTGIAPHPDLDVRVIEGRGFTGTASYRDGHGHGTHVAGIVASSTKGVAPGAKLLIGKVLRDDGDGSYLGIIAGIRWATNWRGPGGERASVIVMSLGGSEDISALHEAIQYAVSTGVLVVCAAGNEGDNSSDTDEYAYPASYPEVVSVGAYNLDWMEPAGYSNSNAEVDIAAPGSGILSTYLGGGYVKMSGTSMAAPHVAGGAALILQQFRQRYGRDPLEPELYAQLIRRAQRITGDPKREGSGLLNLLLDAGLTYEDLTLDQALDILAHLGKIDSPTLWHEVCVTSEAGNYHPGARFLSVLLRKWAADAR